MFLEQPSATKSIASEIYRSFDPCQITSYGSLTSFKLCVLARNQCWRSFVAHGKDLPKVPESLGHYSDPCNHATEAVSKIVARGKRSPSNTGILYHQRDTKCLRELETSLNIFDRPHVNLLTKSGHVFIAKFWAIRYIIIWNAALLAGSRGRERKGIRAVVRIKKALRIGWLTGLPFRLNHHWIYRARCGHRCTDVHISWKLCNAIN